MGVMSEPKPCGDWRIPHGSDDCLGIALILANQPADGYDWQATLGQDCETLVKALRYVLRSVRIVDGKRPGPLTTEWQSITNLAVAAGVEPARLRELLEVTP